MSDIAQAHVRIRPRMTGFKAEVERETHRAFSGVGKIIGGAFAVVGIEAVVHKVAEAAARQQEELTVVRQAVKSTNSAWEVHGQTVDETLRKMAVRFGMTVSDLAQGFTRIQVSTQNTPKTFRLLNAAMDISRARHLGLAQAAVVVAKAQAGNVTGLQRLGIVLPKVTAAQDALKNEHAQAIADGAKYTKQQELQYKQHLLSAKAIDLEATKTSILESIQARFGGQAAAFANTAEGSSERFHEAVNEFEVSVGNALIPTLTRAATVGTGWFQKLADSVAVHHAVAVAAEELGNAFSLVWSIASLLGPPLGVVYKILSQIAGFAGGGGIIAFALGFKTLAIASSLAATAQARYAKIIAAGRGEHVAAASAEEAHAAAMKALVAALEANTVALGRNTAAWDVQAASALRSAEATGAASAALEASAIRAATSAGGVVLAARGVEGAAVGGGAALGRLAGETEKVATKAATLGSKLSGLGAGLFALAGGWTTVAAVALGGLAFGIYKLITAESSWESANRRVTGSLEELAGALHKVEQLRARLAGLKGAIGADKDAIAQDRLNIAFAARAVTAPKGTLEYKQQIHNVIAALHQLHRDEKQLDDDRKARGETQRGIAFKEQQARNRAATAAKVLAAAARDEVAPKRVATRVPGNAGVFVDPVGKHATELQRAQAAADKFGDAIVKDAAKVKGEFAPQLRKNAELLKEYAHQLGHVPKPEQSRIILSNDDAKRKLLDFIADFAVKSRSLAAKSKAGGREIGDANVAGMIVGINGKKPLVVAAVESVIAAMKAAAKAKLKTGSPSQVMRDEVGHPIGDGIAAGILDRNDAVAAAARGLAAAAIKAGKPPTLAQAKKATQTAKKAVPEEGFHGSAQQVKVKEGRAYISQYGKDALIPNRPNISQFLDRQKFGGGGANARPEIEAFWKAHGAAFVALGRAKAAEERAFMHELGSATGRSYVQGIVANVGDASSRVGTALSKLLAGAQDEAKKKASFALPGKNPGLVETGNIDLLHRKVARLKDGIATVHSFSIGTPKGETLLPQVIDGKLVSIRRAIDEFRRTKKNLGTFDSVGHADAYAERLHLQQQKVYADAIRQARAGGQATGQSYSQGVAAGVGEAAERVNTAITSMLGGAHEKGKASIGAHSPSDLARTELGHAISDGIALGILDRNGKVTAALTSQVNDAITSGVQQVRDAILQAKQNLNSIGGGLASTIGNILDRRAEKAAKAGPAAPTGVLAQRLQELLKQVHAGQGGFETQRLAEEVQNQLVAHEAAKPQTADPSALKDKITRRLADLTDLVNRGSISGPLFEKKVDAVLKANHIRPADIEKRFGPALADQLRADRKSLRDQVDALKAGPNPKFGGAGLEAQIIKPLDALKQVQQQIGQAQLSAQKQQLTEAKKHTTELQKANALAKGRATSADITRLIRSIEKHPGNPDAWTTASKYRHRD